jgi:hypothetical protein
VGNDRRSSASQRAQYQRTPLMPDLERTNSLILGHRFWMGILCLTQLFKLATAQKYLAHGVLLAIAYCGFE